MSTLLNDFSDGAKTKGVYLIEITHKTPERIVSQLIGKDRVHEQGTTSLNALMDFRLGGEGYNRTCFALWDGEKIKCAVYVHKTYTPIKTVFDLPGNISNTLYSKAQENTNKPEAYVFYSISGTSGRTLIYALHEHLNAINPNAAKTTLSPCRTYEDYIGPRGLYDFHAKNEEQKRQDAYEYLLRCHNIVENFHLGNGGRIANIHTNAGDYHADRKHNVMVNYLYNDRFSIVETNAKIYKKISGIRDGYGKTEHNVEDIRYRDEDLAKIRPIVMSLTEKEFLSGVGYDHPLITQTPAMRNSLTL
jgi:hypothetical protein